MEEFSPTNGGFRKVRSCEVGTGKILSYRWEREKQLGMGRSSSPSLTPKSKIKHMSAGLLQPVISRSNGHDVFTSGRQKAPREYFMEALFEIFNILKLLHDFINGAAGGVRNG